MIRTIIPLCQNKLNPEKVLESLDLRKHAKHLLECAKRTVEIAIEQDEQAAIDWLDSASQQP